IRYPGASQVAPKLSAAMGVHALGQGARRRLLRLAHHSRCAGARAGTLRCLRVQARLWWRGAACHPDAGSGGAPRALLAVLHGGLAPPEHAAAQTGGLRAAPRTGAPDYVNETAGRAAQRSDPASRDEDGDKGVGISWRYGSALGHKWPE